MKAGEVMTTGAATVAADAPLTEALRLLVEHRISGLPVVDADGALVGVLSEHDFLRGADGKQPVWLDVLLDGNSGQSGLHKLQKGRVADAMSKAPVSVTVETPVSELLELMHREGVKRFPVVKDRAVVGVISRASLLEALFRKVNRTPGASPQGN